MNKPSIFERQVSCDILITSELPAVLSAAPILQSLNLKLSIPPQTCIFKLFFFKKVYFMCRSVCLKWVGALWVWLLPTEARKGVGSLGNEL